MWLSWPINTDTSKSVILKKLPTKCMNSFQAFFLKNNTNYGNILNNQSIFILTKTIIVNQKASRVNPLQGNIYSLFNVSSILFIKIAVEAISPVLTIESQNFLGWERI